MIIAPQKFKIIQMKDVSRANIGYAIQQRKDLLKHAEQAIHVRKASDDLLSYTKATFDGIWTDNWHQRLLCNRLQDLEQGVIRFLIVTLPPRHTKSEFCSRRFPGYFLGRNPKKRIIISSYEKSLARGMSQSVQDIMRSDIYSRIFKGVEVHPTRKSPEQWYLKGVIEPTMVASGRKGPITGKGGHLMILDDPLKNYEEGQSMTVLDSLWNWYVSTFRTRLEPNGGVLIVMTRWNMEDPVGRIEQQMAIDQNMDKFTILNLPAIATETDEYRQRGDALDPLRYDLQALLSIKATQGELMFNIIFQGRPTVQEGTFFKRSWFEKAAVEAIALPDQRLRVRAWDWAVTDEEHSADGDPDYTVGSKWSKGIVGDYYKEDQVRDQLEWPKARQLIIDTAIADGLHVAIVIENIGKDRALLKSLLAKLRQMGFTVYTRKVNKKKIIAARYYQQVAETGACHFVKAALWNPPALAELSQYPNGAHDDIVDSDVIALEWLRLKTVEMIPLVSEQEFAPFLEGKNLKDEHRLAHFNAGQGLDPGDESSVDSALNTNLTDILKGL